MSTKKYFQDRVVLLLLTVMIFLAVLSSVLVLLRMDGLSSGNPLIQFRENLGERAFRAGDANDHIRFIIFAVLTGTFHTFLSLKVYHIRKHFSYTVLGLGILLLVLTIIVSSELVYHS